MITRSFVFPFALTFLLYAVATGEGIGQKVVNSSYAPIGSSDIYVWFDSIVSKVNSGLINGRVYTPPPKGFKSHHYLEGEPASAVIRYNGHIFKGYTVLYDVYSDLLIIQTPREGNKFQYITPETQRVDHFFVYGHIFRNISNDFTERKKISGYFDVLFETPELSLLAKRSKEQYLEKGRMRYRSIDTYYIRTKKGWTVFTRKNDLYQIFDSRENRKKVKAFARDKKIKVGRRDDASLKQLFLFSSSLLPES